MMLEKNVSKLLCLLLFATMTLSCSDADETEEKLQNITLVANKNNLKSDGSETITFSVKGGDKDLTDYAQIVYQEENTPLSGKTFSTNIPGTYTFYATYNGLKSAGIQIKAAPIVLILTADTTAIKSNGKSLVTFSATADEVVVTEEVEFFLVNEDSDKQLESNVFSTKNEGTYEFYCKYREQLSDRITITAIPFILTLTADTSSIKANGNEAVTFTVTADNENITNEAQIYRKDGETTVLLENNTFETTAEGNYEFFAQYQEQTSNTICVEAFISRLFLTADTTKAKTGENITFTAISDDIHDVSSEVTLHISTPDKEFTQKSNVFIPSSFGTYTVYASFEDRVSNTITVEIHPATITLSTDKTAVKSTGVDTATFIVYADGIIFDDANIYIKGETQDQKINDCTFTSNLQGTYTFYAEFAGVRSDCVAIDVNFVNFVKQSCAIGAFSTWCGYSPQMQNPFHQVQSKYPDQIQIISIHNSVSSLNSSDINTNEFILIYNHSEETPFGIMDLDSKLTRKAESIYQTHQHMQYTHPATSSIAVESQKNNSSIDVTLKVKVNETNEYRICAVIVEDSVIKRQITFVNNSKENAVWDENFVHNGVATYIMPGTNLYTGKSLGTIQAGKEVIEKFSIPLHHVVTEKRIVNHDNCRVIAYVLKKEGDKYYINNAASCSINGFVDYKYEE